MMYLRALELRSPKAAGEYLISAAEGRELPKGSKAGSSSHGVIRGDFRGFPRTEIALRPDRALPDAGR